MKQDVAVRNLIMAKLKIRSEVQTFFVHLRHVISCSDLVPELYSFMEAEEVKHS